MSDQSNHAERFQAVTGEQQSQGPGPVRSTRMPVQQPSTQAAAGSCERCASFERCHMTRLLELARQSGSTPILFRKTYRDRESIFRQGDTLQGLFVVKSGSVKCGLAGTEDDELVASFRLPGELLDTGAMGTGSYGCSATALERSALCFLPVDDSSDLFMRIPGSLGWYLKLAAGELVRAHATSLLLTRMSAGVRLARFLLDLSARFDERGYSSHTFNLSMTRHDIANHLGLTVETVSRQMHGFQQKGLLRVERRHITLINIDALATVAGIS